MAAARAREMMRIELGEETEVANKALKARAAIFCLASIGILTSIVMLAVHASDDAPEVVGATWQEHGYWYISGAGVFRASVCSKAPSGADPCPVGWREVTGSTRRCYKLIPKTLRWAEAQNNCKVLEGGDLASIPDEAANKEVSALCAQLQPCWIGATWANDWNWTDTTEWSYSHWAADEPGNFLAETLKVALGQSASLDEPKKQFALMGSAVAQLISSIIMVSIVGCLCWGYHWGARNRHDYCLIFTSVCDGICICLSVLGIISSIGALVQNEGSGALVFDLVVRFFAVAAFTVACIFTAKLRNTLVRKELERLEAAAASDENQVVGVPVGGGQPITGTAQAQPSKEETVV
mmetsp:Transcript_50985/g.147128  ORF Transcript_50985/g.147128 Transcript_50985/m.147128 type:complete len:352 (-) Transcript_50985:43-1098(-)